MMEQASEFYIHEVHFPSPAEEENASPIAHLVQQILDEVAQQEHLHDRRTIYIIDPGGPKNTPGNVEKLYMACKNILRAGNAKIDAKNSPVSSAGKVNASPCAATA